MKRLMNAVETMLDESLDGFAAAHSDIVELGPERKFVRRRAMTQGKVALISGGGSGHEPMHAGFVGLGMLDAACPGQVFTSPTPDQMVAAIEAVDTGAGCLMIVKNYEGDVMNFEMAGELAAASDRKVESVVTNDDVAVPNSTWSTGRRGVAGTLVVEKIVGRLLGAGGVLACVVFVLWICRRTSTSSYPMSRIPSRRSSPWRAAIPRRPERLLRRRDRAQGDDPRAAVRRAAQRRTSIPGERDQPARNRLRAAGEHRPRGHEALAADRGGRRASGDGPEGRVTPIGARIEEVEPGLPAVGKLEPDE